MPGRLQSLCSRLSESTGARTPLSGASTSSWAKPWEELPPATSQAGRAGQGEGSQPARVPPRRLLLCPLLRLCAARAPPGAVGGGGGGGQRVGREAPRDVSVGSVPPPPALTPHASPPPARSPGQARREGAGPRLHHSTPAAARPEGAGGASERDASRSAPGPGDCSDAARETWRPGASEEAEPRAPRRRRPLQPGPCRTAADRTQGPAQRTRRRRAPILSPAFSMLHFMLVSRAV